MRSICFGIFALGIGLSSNNAQAFDTSEFNAICQNLRAEELEELKLEFAEGYLTEEEMAYESRLLMDDEQCLCYFEKMLEIAGEEYTLKILEFEKNDYTLEEWKDIEVPKLPPGMDLDTLDEMIENACEIPTE